MPASPTSNGRVSSRQSKTNSAWAVGAKGAQFQVPAGGVGASVAASLEASAEASAAPPPIPPAPVPPAPPAPASVPPSVQLGVGIGAAAAILAAQRHQLEALVKKQVVTAPAGLQPPPSVTSAPQLASPDGILVIVAPPPSTMETSIRTGAPGLTELLGVQPTPPATPAARQTTSNPRNGRFIQVSL